MELKYAAAACMLSTASIMLLSPWLCRSQRQSGMISASLGIIIFRIVKSIFVECGWELAASAGTGAGLFLESLMMGCGIVFFYEINRLFSDSRWQTVLPAAGVILICAGKGLMQDSRLMPDVVGFLVGKASEWAMISAAIKYVQEDSGEIQAKNLSVFVAICSVVSVMSESAVRGSGLTSTAPTAAMLVMLGCCELVFVLAKALQNISEVSAAGLAVGIMVSYGFESLTG